MSFIFRWLISIYMMLSLALVSWILLISILFIKPISSTMHQQISHILQDGYLRIAVYIAQQIDGISLTIAGDVDQFSNHKHTLFLCTHNKFDFQAILIFAYHTRSLAQLRIFLHKSFVNYVTGKAWAGFLMNWPLVSKHWNKHSKKILNMTLETARTTNEHAGKNKAVSLWMFPEGGYHSVSSIKKNREFAQANMLPILQHLLLPDCTRTTDLLLAIRKILPSSDVFIVTLVSNDDRNKKDMTMRVEYKQLNHFPDYSSQLDDYWNHLYQEIDNSITFFKLSGSFSGKKDQSVMADVVSMEEIKLSLILLSMMMMMMVILVVIYTYKIMMGL